MGFNWYLSTSRLSYYKWFGLNCYMNNHIISGWWQNQRVRVKLKGDDTHNVKKWIYTNKSNHMLNVSKKIVKSFKRLGKYQKSNRNIFLIFLAVIMVWRWIQDLLTLCIFPSYPILSCIVCIAIGITILIIDDGKIDELSEHNEHSKEK